MIKTPYKRLIKYVGNEHKFTNEKEFEKYLHEKNKAPDYISIAGVLYTMEEYDESGQSITYQNRRNGYQLEIMTTARYTNGYKDAEVIMYPAGWWRNDLVYAD